MGSLAILPRTLLHRTRWGTALFFDRRHGLLARDEAGRWRSISAEELRCGYPEAFAAWLRLAALLPAGIVRPTARQSGGDSAA